MNTLNTLCSAAPQLDDLDRFLINAAFEIGRIADDVGGSLMILAYYADGDDCGITPTVLMELMECDASRYLEGLSMLAAAGIKVPAGWRLS
jgi:hypothetical protein